jgi:prepilin-type N-terminal cleavage/methylation domain-containing protein
MRRKQNAFTLIELLVVISIIALLISILMPALAKAKKQARFVICQGNLRQLQLGMIYYKDEYEDRLLPYRILLDRATDTWKQICWIQWIDLQVDNVDEVRICPETPSSNEWHARASIMAVGDAKLVWVAGFLPQDLTETDPFERDYQHGSYAMSSWWHIDDPRETPNMPAEDNHWFHKYGAIKRPGETPCFSDANWLDHWPYDDAGFPNPDNIDLQYGDPWNEQSFGRLLIDRHNCRINHSFADGHVEPSTLPDLWTLKWYNGYIPRYNAPDYENLY